MVNTVCQYLQCNNMRRMPWRCRWVAGEPDKRNRTGGRGLRSAEAGWSSAILGPRTRLAQEIGIMSPDCSAVKLPRCPAIAWPLGIMSPDCYRIVWKLKPVSNVITQKSDGVCDPYTLRRDIIFQAFGVYLKSFGLGKPGFYIFKALGYWSVRPFALD